MKNNLTPKYIPEEFLAATKYGWVDSRTNEVLVAIPNLDKRLKEFEFIKNESKEEKQQIVIDEVESKIDEILNEPTESKEENVEEQKQEAPKPKRRGRPAKNK